MIIIVVGAIAGKETEAETEIEVVIEIVVGIEIEAETEIEAEIETEVGTETEAETEVEIGIEAMTRIEVETTTIKIGKRTLICREKKAFSNYSINGSILKKEIVNMSVIESETWAMM